MLLLLQVFRPVVPVTPPRGRHVLGAMLLGLSAFIFLLTVVTTALCCTHCRVRASTQNDMYNETHHQDSSSIAQKSFAGWPMISDVIFLYCYYLLLIWSVILLYCYYFIFIWFDILLYCYWFLLIWSVILLCCFLLIWSVVVLYGYCFLLIWSVILLYGYCFLLIWSAVWLYYYSFLLICSA